MPLVTSSLSIFFEYIHTRIRSKCCKSATSWPIIWVADNLAQCGIHCHYTTLNTTLTTVLNTILTTVLTRVYHYTIKKGLNLVRMALILLWFTTCIYHYI